MHSAFDYKLLIVIWIEVYACNGNVVAMTTQPSHKKPIASRIARRENYSAAFYSMKKQNNCTATTSLDTDEYGLEWMNTDFFIHANR